MLQRFAIKAIKFYQEKISSKVFPGCCKFSPTCSHYSLEAIEKYGFFQGGWISLKRMLRCNPFNRNTGIDPVPTKDENGKLIYKEIIKVPKTQCGVGIDCQPVDEDWEKWKRDFVDEVLKDK